MTSMKEHVSSLAGIASPGPELLQRLKLISSELYRKKLDSDSRPVYESLIRETRRFVCTKTLESGRDDPKKGTERSRGFPMLRSKSAYEVARDSIIFIYKRLCSFSPELSAFLLDLSLVHLKECKYCTETVGVLQKLGGCVKDFKLSMSDRRVYNRIVEHFFRVTAELITSGSTGPYFAQPTLSPRQPADTASQKSLLAPQVVVHLPASANADSTEGRVELAKSAEDNKEAKDGSRGSDNAIVVGEEEGKSATNQVRANYYLSQPASRSLRRLNLVRNVSQTGPPETNEGTLTSKNSKSGNTSMHARVIVPFRPSVPRLNMNLVQEALSPAGGPLVQTRSSRRAEGNKSITREGISTRSGHYSGIFSSSHKYNGNIYETEPE